MVIETERLSDSEFLYYYFAGAVREAPGFVSELSKYVPRVADVVLRKKINLRERAAEKLFTQTNRARRLAPRPQERECFINYVVGR